MLICGCARQDTFIKKRNMEPQFNGIIEDFEKGLQYWEFSKNVETVLTRITVDDQNIGQLNFNARFSLEEYNPYIHTMMYRRKMDFRKYKGVKFSAKGDSDILYKFKIFEKEHYYRKSCNEVWYRVFKVKEEWQEFKISFSDMIVEEYWEQDYISDNLQIFTNIVGIGITAQNRTINKEIKGIFYIDNIVLY